MNKAVLFLAALGASTALCAPVPAEKAEKRDTIPIARVPDVPPPSRETLDASIRKAADFLLKEQNRDGSWGNHTRTKGLNVLCPYPEGPRSFRTASTSLCVIGLLTSPERRPRRQGIPGQGAAVPANHAAHPETGRHPYRAWRMGPCLRPLRPEPGGAEPSCGCPFARRTQKGGLPPSQSAGPDGGRPRRLGLLHI